MKVFEKGQVMSRIKHFLIKPLILCNDYFELLKKLPVVKPSHFVFCHCLVASSRKWPR